MPPCRHLSGSGGHLHGGALSGLGAGKALDQLDDAQHDEDTKDQSEDWHQGSQNRVVAREALEGIDQRAHVGENQSDGAAQDRQDHDEADNCLNDSLSLVAKT